MCERIHDWLSDLRHVRMYSRLTICDTSTCKQHLKYNVHTRASSSEFIARLGRKGVVIFDLVPFAAHSDHNPALGRLSSVAFVNRSHQYENEYVDELKQSHSG